MNDLAPASAVSVEHVDGVAVLTIDFPPVNALGWPVRDGLLAGIKAALADPEVQAIVLIGAHDRFIAGADIREFGQPKRGAELQEIQAVMDASPKPIVAAIDGHALGGGLEVALAASHRVAASRAKVGLPEVNLGLLPGAGGTQRGTRLMGPAIALDMILNGTHVSAARGREIGLLDAVVDGDVRAAAVAFAKAKAAEGTALPRAIERTDKIAGTDPTLFADIRSKNAKKWVGMVAPFKIVDCVEAATRLPPQEGLAFEKAAFKACLDAPARAAQVHLFFAERSAAKVIGADGVAPGKITSVGIVGAGTMGGGIAMSLVNAGIAVKLLDATAEGLAAGMAKVKSNYATSVKRGSTSQDKVDAALGRITTVMDYAALADVDLVIEAAFENMDVKREIFGKLDAVCKPGAILATNTSALDIDAIARATTRPEDVIGMHFFSPANVMKLLEVVRGSLVSKQTVVTAMAFAKVIGKVAVLAGNAEGFIGNRILKIYGREADFLLEDGATPWQVDTALKAFGFPMGLYLMRDMAGLDIGWRMRQNSAAERDPRERYAPLADRICEQGRFGQKSGAGYYRYEGRDASPDPAVEAMLTTISAEKGITRTPVGDEEIVWRILSAMVNEGANIVHEGVAQRASDIDVTYAFGYGFPKYRGGPMFWAQTVGLDRVLETIRHYHAIEGDTWVPSPLLERLVAEGKGWDGKPVVAIT